MIIDRQNTVSLAQAVTATAVSTDTIDLSQVRDIGPGESIRFAITVDVLAASAGATTVDFQVITSASALLTTPTVVGASGPIPKADLTAGRRPIEVAVQRSVLLAQPIGQRFVGIQYVVATGPLTGGSFTASIVGESFQDVGKNYPSGFTII